jgi:hypothetical protein
MNQGYPLSEQFVATVLLVNLTTRMHVPNRIAKLALIPTMLALVNALLVHSVNAHRHSAFVAAGATLWKTVRSL